ncbi:hypothetical protein PR003_g10249, partial [Phytophthora rubi]
YSDYFAGGIAFEYSTENANSVATSAYPFKTYGPQNYGLGYFSPEDCTDSGSNCTYERFPNFKFLAEAYASYDGSSEPTLSNYEVPANHAETSACPSGSPDLRYFQWAGDSSSSESCPTVADGHFQCSPATAPVSAVSVAPLLLNAMFAAENTEAPSTSATPEITSQPLATQTPTTTSQAPAVRNTIHDGCRIR